VKHEVLQSHLSSSAQHTGHSQLTHQPAGQKAGRRLHQALKLGDAVLAVGELEMWFSCTVPYASHET